MRKDKTQTETMLYLIPDLAQRRAELSASMAYFAHVLTRATPPLQPHQRFPCYQCGQAAPGDWCNTCETLGNHPLREQPNLITPYCHVCMAANLECRVCDVLVMCARPTVPPMRTSRWPVSRSRWPATWIDVWLWDW